MGTETRAQALRGAAGAKTPQIGLVGKRANPECGPEELLKLPKPPSQTEAQALQNQAACARAFSPPKPNLPPLSLPEPPSRA